MTALPTLPASILQRIVQVIHREPELNGCMVGYSHLGQNQVIHKGLSPTVNFRDKLVIIELDTVKANALPKPGAAPATNISKLWPELVGVGCNLLAFTLSAVGVGAAAASTPATGPVGPAIAVCAWTGVATSGVQLTNAIIRFWAIAVDPYGDTLERWDGNVTYDAFIIAVDAAGVISGVAGLALGGKALWNLLQTTKALRGQTPRSLANLDHRMRGGLMEKAYAELQALPQTRAKLKDAMGVVKKDAAGQEQYLQRVKTNNMHKKHRALKMHRTMSKVAEQQMAKSIKDVVKTLPGFAFSAGPASVLGSASGSVDRFAVPRVLVAVHILEREQERIAGNLSSPSHGRYEKAMP